MQRKIKGIAKVNGVKNHNPVRLSLDFIDPKNIIEANDIKKLWSVKLYTIKNSIIAVITAQIAGRN